MQIKELGNDYKLDGDTERILLDLINKIDDLVRESNRQDKRLYLIENKLDEITRWNDG